MKNAIKAIRKVYYTLLANPAYLRLGVAAAVMCLTVFTTATPLLADGAEDFASMGQNVGEQAGGIAEGAKMLFLLLGFLLVGAGLVMLAFSKNKGSAIAMLAVGFILTSIGVFITVGSTSIFGSDVSEVGDLVE